MAVAAEDGAVGLGEDDALQAQRAGLDDHADHGEHQGQLVGDELAGGAEATQQRVLVGRGPAGHEHADDRERRHGQGEEDADVEVLDDEVGAARARPRRAGSVEISTTSGARAKTQRSAFSGKMSSFWRNP